MDKAKDIDKIIIGIGSSQMHNTIYNPFTSDERKEMIKIAISKIKKKVEIICIPDINDYPNWVKHVEKLCGNFNVIYSGNNIIKQLFSENKYEIRSIKLIHEISATQIREMIVKIDTNWVDKVPIKLVCYLSNIKVAHRLREIYIKYISPHVTSDVIINYKNKGIILIKRKNEPFKDFWALPGGFIDTGKETIEECAVREVNEETSLKINIKDLKLLRIYSYPYRDPRGHTISAVYYIDIKKGKLKAKDDAIDIKIFKKLPYNMAFDHNKIIEDYKERSLNEKRKQ